MNSLSSWVLRPWAVALVLAGAAGLVSPAAAQRGAVVRGAVRTADSTQAPIAGALVLDGSGAPMTRTDSLGRYRLAGVPAGVRTIVVRRTGYDSTSTEISLFSTDDRTLDFRLKPAPVQLADITVIGTPRDEEERQARLADVPGGVALISAKEIGKARTANLKDALQFTPGVYIQPRFGAADESQISIRGSGLRNNFHARGINLLVNGMPYRNADGFTDFESIELLTADAIEVYKGANALRFGGSTMGGAINVVTRTGYSAPPLTVVAQGGSSGFFKSQVASGDVLGRFDYYASYAHTGLAGYRDWSGQRRERVNLHGGYLLSPAVDLRAFYFFAHVNEQLPGALTSAEFTTSPTQAAPDNVNGRYGRVYDLHHIGAQLRAQLGTAQRLEVSPYFQYRDIDHPIFRVINQQSRDIGAEVRYENAAVPLGRRSRLTIGFQPSYMNMDDRQFQNEEGRHGALAKDQKDEVTNLAAYGEQLVEVAAGLSLIAGGRYEYSVREAADHFLSDGNQSDRRVFRAFSPKVGLIAAVPSTETKLFANASRMFEPPLLLELNSLTQPGFIDLVGQSAWQFELGTRGRQGAIGWDLSLYDVELHHEILNENVTPFPGAAFTVPTYRNAPRSRHYGVELGVEASMGSLSTRLAYTYGRYRFVDDAQYGDNDIPGAANHLINASVTVAAPAGIRVTPSLEWAPHRFFVNSANTVTNEGWFMLGARAEWDVPHLGGNVFAEVRNLTNTVRSLSVQVDNAAGRYFEPSDRRAFYVGMRWEGLQ
jgi:iron complex outermembrane receptor protein